MRRVAGLAILLLSGGCWLAAGPGGASLAAAVACHHQMTAGHTGHHHRAPGDGPCFCDQMTGTVFQAVVAAVPAPPAPRPVVTMAVRMQAYPPSFPLPPSPSRAPESPPPNGLV